MQPQTLITTYGPIGLSAIVVIGMIVGWLIGRVDTTLLLSVVVPVLAANGVIGITLKQSIAAMQTSAAMLKKTE